MIEHDNVFYLTDISEIGGVETFIYENCKKYKDRDICVVYKTACSKQLNRLRKFCRCYKLQEDTYINCKVAIINYDSSIIDHITKDIWKENLKPNDKRGIYETIHGDYTNPAYSKIPGDPRVKSFIGITKYICETYPKVSGYNNIMLGYNTLTIDEEENDKALILVSATRLSKVKGKDRMNALANAMDRKGIIYKWFVFTNDTSGLSSPNVIFLKPNYDISKWIRTCDYVVQLSDTEACSYTINEALYRNKPVIATPLPYLEEIGYKDNETGYIINFDCNNVEEVVNKIRNIPKFTFKPMVDIYGELLTNKKSTYKEEMEMKVKVQCIENYFDVEENERKVKSLNEWYEDPDNHPNRVEWITTRERADHLVSRGKVKIIEVIKEKRKIEKAVNKIKTEKSKRK